MKKETLKKRYQRLDATKYTNVVKGTLLYCDPYDGEFVTLLMPGSVFTIARQYDALTGIFLGWNIYAEHDLLETKSTKRKAEKFLRRLSVESQREMG